MSDAAAASLLGAASSLLAVLAILYALWGPDLQRASKLQPAGPSPEAIRSARSEMCSVLISRALPLAGFGWAAAIVFGFDVIAVVAHGLRVVSETGLGAFQHYDAGKAAFVLTYGGIVAIACVATAICWTIAKRVREFTVPRG